jgi:single-stranded-DNA-specific exonuclease
MHAPATPASESFLGVARSLGGRRWVPRRCDDRTALALSQRLGLPDIVGRVLAARGVGLDGAEKYLSPRLRDLLPDPSRLKDMDRAAERLAAAIRHDERIVILGDYDVDGATSAALLVRFLRAVGAKARVYVPDRIKEGYGPNAGAIRLLAAEGARVIVTVDCGTLAHDALAVAGPLGVDVIVVDHHVAEPTLPPAFAIVNPNRLDESSSVTAAVGTLAAVGVAYLLAIATNRVLRREQHYTGGRAEPDLLRWLDLVALGTVCDVVPLKGLNRALVAQGLKVMAARGNPGIAALVESAKVNGAPNAWTAGFLLGPRVNAGGRVGRSEIGARMLASDDAAEARALAFELEGYNAERRAIEAAVHDDALARVEAEGDPGALAFVAGEGWHAGVIGIVASRLTEALRRPSIVVALSGEVGKGSGRSVPGVDLGAAVIAAAQAGLLLNGGGHPMAAGFTVQRSRVAELAEFLRARVASSFRESPGLRDLALDGALAAAAATPSLLEKLEGAGPFGAGNAEPRFAVPAAAIVKAEPVGDGHVRVILGGGDGRRLKAIAFRSLETPMGQALLSARGMALHLAGHLRADTWQGRREAQLIVEDAAPVL